MQSHEAQPSCALPSFLSFHVISVPYCKDSETNPTNTQKVNIFVKNAPYFKHGTEWNAEKVEKSPIFAKKSARNEQL